MRGARLLLAIGCAAALLAVVAAAPQNPALHAVVGPVAIPVEPPADPFPLRRQFLSDDQLDRLTADTRGPLRKLSKAEFEAKVRAASDAQQLARTPPQLVTAAYRGRYEPGRVSGTADWTFANPAGQPALVSMDALRVAVSDLTPAADPAVGGQRPPTIPPLLFRGKPGGKELPGTFLWVGGERETAVAFGWSARGVEETDEEKFDLGVPAAAIAALELTLPADRLPTLTAGGKRIDATGPLPGQRENERVWKWAVGGQAGVVLAVRPATTPGAEVTASRTATYELNPGEAKAVFDFTLDSPRGLIREQTFATDAGVKVTAVSGDGVEMWRQEPADGKAAGKLVVAWREPTAAAKVKVTTTTVLGAGAVAWACPGVRATGTLPGADAIEVSVSPEFKLDGWSANDYRPVVTGGSGERGSGALAPDLTRPPTQAAKGVQVQFTGTLALGADGTRRPPVVRVRSAEPEVATEEQLTWRVEPGSTRLSAVVKVKVARGPLPQFVVRTAAGYALESATLVPEDASVGFGQLPGTPNAWVVEPSRAVPTGGTVEVRLEFRGPPGPPGPDSGDPAPAAVPIPFPHFSPAGAVERQGTLTAVGDGVTASARTVLPVTPTADGWEVKYRGREPGGTGLFTPEPTGVSVDAVRLAVRNEQCEAALVGRADDGPVGSLTVFVPHPDGRVKAADGMTAVPLPAAGMVPLFTSLNGWSALAGAGAVPNGVYWRVNFAKPRTGPFELTATYPAAAVDPDSPLVLPLPHLGGGRGTGVTELSPELAAGYHIPDPPAGDFPAVVTLVPLTVKPAAPAADGDWALADVRQLNQIDGDGGLSVTITGRITRAAGPTFDITLPPDATVESAQVAGKWVTPRPGDAVRLPLPDLPPDGTPFDLRYRLPAPPLGPLPKYTSPRPGLPAVVPVTPRWQFARGWLPWPSLSVEDDCHGQFEVRVARATVLRGVGFGLGGLLLAVGVRLIRGSGGRCHPEQTGKWRTLLVALVAAGCGAGVWVGSVGWLKVLQPPLFAGLVVLMLAAFRTVPHPSARRPSTVVKAAASGVVLALAGVLVQAQTAPEPAVVYVVGTDAQAVYAPQSVLDKLDALAAPPLPDVIIKQAEYTATAEDAVVTFDATFALECPRAGDHPFTLPLAGVRLEAMQLDGTDAFPDASKPDRYTLTVKGKGKHTLTARFAVMPAGTGGDREARFNGPDVPVCRVTFDAGAKGRQPDVPTRRGGQTVADRTTTSDHGGGRTVAVRWREAATDGTKTTIGVKEAGVWDATDTPDAGVWAAFAYQITGGSVERFEIDIPAGLVATKVLVRPIDPRASPVGVRGWRIAPSADGGTRVVARLQQPADGRVLVVVRAVPAKPLGNQPVLRFPRAVGIADADRDSVYAVRFPGVTTTAMGVSGTIDVPADTIVKDFPAVPEFGFDKQPPARVVKRVAAVAELRPTLAPAPAFAPLGAEVVFTCGAWVEVDGAVRAGVKDGGFAEFVVPDSIDVRDVRAVGMAGWGRSGNKVQVWLKQPAAEVLVRWSGSVPATGELPLPRWSTAVSPAEPTTVRVRAAEGYSVKLVQNTGLKPKAGVEGEAAFTFEGSPLPPKVEITPITPTPIKPAEPPSVKPPPAVAPPPSAAPAAGPVPTSSAPFNPWPLIGAIGWGVGLLAAAGLLRGWRWQPERVTAVGVLGLLAAGVGTPLGWAFAAAAGAGVLWRLLRTGRRLV